MGEVRLVVHGLGARVEVASSRQTVHGLQGERDRFNVFRLTVIAQISLFKTLSSSFSLLPRERESVCVGVIHNSYSDQAQTDRFNTFYRNVS